MRRSRALAAGLLATLLVAAPAGAAPPITGDTELLGAPASGTTVWVRVSVTSEGPVVPHEFQVQNECRLPDRGGRTVQRDDIVDWVSETGGVPTTDMPVYLQSIPAGSTCTVFLTRGTVQLKGSVTSYTVG